MMQVADVAYDFAPLFRALKRKATPDIGNRMFLVLRVSTHLINYYKESKLILDTFLFDDESNDMNMMMMMNRECGNRSRG